MTTENKIALPEGWRLEGTNAKKTAYWVSVDLSNFKIYRSDGNEQLWYVDQWWMEEGEKEITGQCVTLEHAIDNLRRYLAGEPVPDGDEITVLFPDAEPETAPVLHNIKGERFVHLPERN